MPHSPYFHQVEPPLSDLDFATSKYDFQRIRWEREDGLDDEFALDKTLHSGELLIEQCEFLEEKLNIKKRENSQLVDRVVTLELDSSSMKDENWLQKEELAALKAEIEQLKKENKAYQEELAATRARLRMASATKQSSMRDDQDKATEPAAAAEGKYGRYGKSVTSEPNAYATWMHGARLKREHVPDPTFDPKKVRWMAAGLKGPDEEDATPMGDPWGNDNLFQEPRR